ncbi:MAG: TIGR02186 family protein, partial [Rhizobiaceae bacterium]
PGAVQFLSQTLFRATVSLAPDVPVGTHRARAFLFKGGNFVAQTSAPLVILKGGFERRVYQFAQNDSFFYGVFCVMLALLTGWLGRLIFRKE